MPVANVGVTTPTTKKYPPLPKEMYHCQLLDIENKMETVWGKPAEEEMKIIFTFVVIEDGDLYGRRLYVRATPKLSKFKGGSNLYKILVGLKGKDFTDAEVANPDSIASDAELNDLIGRQVRLAVGVKEKEKTPGEFKNVIDSYFLVKKELPEFDADKVQREESSDTVIKVVATEVVAEVATEVGDMPDLNFDE